MNQPNKLITIALAAMTFALLISGCQKNQAAAPDTTTPPQASAPSGTPQGGEGQAAQPGQTTQPDQTAPAAPATPAKPVKLSPLTYVDAEKQVITQSAKAVNVKTVYLPQQGAVDDKLDQVGTTGDGDMTISYYKMLVMESPKEIKPAGTVESRKAVQLKIGKAEWITTAGQSALHLKLGDTYIAISSAKAVSQDEILAIAETLAPMK